MARSHRPPAGRRERRHRHAQRQLLKNALAPGPDAVTVRAMAIHQSSPQAKEMADESMASSLTAQAEAIWPQEEPIFARHPLRKAFLHLDVGCGTGEIPDPERERYAEEG